MSVLKSNIKGISSVLLRLKTDDDYDPSSSSESSDFTYHLYGTNSSLPSSSVVVVPKGRAKPIMAETGRRQA